MALDTVSALSQLANMEDTLAARRVAHMRPDLVQTIENASRELRMDLVQQGVTFEDFCDVVFPMLGYAKWNILDISDNQLGPGGASLLAGALASLSLRELSIAYNNIGDDGAIALALVLPSTAVTKIELEGNGLTDRCVFEIARVLPQSNITELYLSHNQVTDEGVFALCPVINRLKVLDLFSNRLTDAGIISISAVIPPCMFELYLGDNIRVGDGGVVPLAHALKTSNVRILGLMKNSITDVGVRALCEAAKVSHLNEILLNRNPMSVSVATELECILLICDTMWYRQMVTLCSTRDVPRIGQRSVFKVVPNELIRRIAVTLFEEDLSGVGSQENDEGEDDDDEEGEGDNESDEDDVGANDEDEPDDDVAEAQ